MNAVYPSLRGRRVIVTGGGSGIGAGLVEAFVAQGAAVAFVDNAIEPSHDLVDRLEGTAMPPLFEPLDLADVAALPTVFARLIGALGGVDVLVNNAGSDDRHTVDEITPAYWDERMNVNLRHQFFAAQAVVPAMRAQRRGVILNFGSISWHLALAGLTVYQTAKAAVEGLTRSLARELGGDGIRVNTIVPGNVKTPRQDRWYSPDDEAAIVAAQCLPGRVLPADVAALALFLASDDARMCTGHAYWIDAGWR